MINYKGLVFFLGFVLLLSFGFADSLWCDKTCNPAMICNIETPSYSSFYIQDNNFTNLITRCSIIQEVNLYYKEDGNLYLDEIPRNLTINLIPICITNTELLPVLDLNSDSGFLNYNLDINNLYFYNTSSCNLTDLNINLVSDLDVNNLNVEGIVKGITTYKLNFMLNNDNETFKVNNLTMKNIRNSNINNLDANNLTMNIIDQMKIDNLDVNNLTISAIAAMQIDNLDVNNLSVVSSGQIIINNLNININDSSIIKNLFSNLNGLHINKKNFYDSNELDLSEISNVSNSNLYFYLGERTGNKYITLSNIYDSNIYLIKTDEAIDENFYNLLDLSNSENVIVYGPEFDNVNGLGNFVPEGSYFIKFTNVNDSTIRDSRFYNKTYSQFFTSIIGLDINNCENINITNNVFMDLKTGIQNSDSTINVYSNSFSEGVFKQKIKYINNLNFNGGVIAFNNFFKGDHFKLKGNDRYQLGGGNDKTKSIGDSGICNIPNTIVYDIFDLSNIDLIPIYYFDNESKLVNESYNPWCFGGNLYYSKTIGCSGGCYNDTSRDGIADNDKYGLGDNSYDYAPLIYDPNHQGVAEDQYLQIQTEYDSKTTYNPGDTFDFNLVIKPNSFLVGSILDEFFGSDKNNLIIINSVILKINSQQIKKEINQEFMPDKDVDKYVYDFNIEISDILLDKFSLLKDKNYDLEFSLDYTVTNRSSICTWVIDPDLSGNNDTSKCEPYEYDCIFAGTDYSLVKEQCDPKSYTLTYSPENSIHYSGARTVRTPDNNIFVVIILLIGIASIYLMKRKKS